SPLPPFLYHTTRLPPSSTLFPYTTLFRSIAYHVEKGADITVGVVEVPARESRNFGVLTATEWNRVTKFAEKPEAPDTLNLVTRLDRKSTRLNSSHSQSRMPSSA